MIEHLLGHMTGLVHVLLALVSLLCGTVVVFIRKGTRRHVWFGRAYVVGMVLLNVTGLMIYEVFEGFGPFHWLAVLSLATVIAGYIPVRSRKPFWKHRHAFFMAGSYVGLLAATAAEIASRVPGWDFGVSVIVSSVVVVVLGVVVMQWRIPRLLESEKQGSE